MVVEQIGSIAAIAHAMLSQLAAIVAELDARICRLDVQLRDYAEKDDVANLTPSKNLYGST
jgi:hypothetical protein